MQRHDGRLTRRGLLAAAAGSWLLQACGGGGDDVTGRETPTEQASASRRMNAVALTLVRNSKLAPPAVARALAIVNTAAYDAYAAYHPTAVGTRWSDASERRPAAEHTLANRSVAVAHAAYVALADLFPAQRATLDAAFRDAGYTPPDGGSPGSGSPEHVGQRAAAAVVAYRHLDGSNQLGHESASGLPYSDTIGYVPANTPDRVDDPSRWQPLRHPGLDGTLVEQTFLTPHWTRVKPFALASGGALRPAAPALYGSAALREQAEQVLRIADALDEREKAIAEYWADGPSSELPPGHWALFCGWVCERDRADLETDVRLFFAVSNAALDAGIAAWDAKLAYDSVRPVTAIRLLYAGQMLYVPGSGRTRQVAAEQWLPYQPSWFPTPPFAEYTSGHSTFSAACAEVLRLGTGSDFFGASARFETGASKVEPGQAPAAPVTLGWSTFTEAAAEAGYSRLYGGIHFSPGNEVGLSMGREIGRRVWDRAERYWRGQG